MDKKGLDRLGKLLDFGVGFHLLASGLRIALCVWAVIHIEGNTNKAHSNSNATTACCLQILKDLQFPGQNVKKIKMQNLWIRYRIPVAVPMSEKTNWVSLFCRRPNLNIPILYSLLKLNSWTYNFVEVSGHKSSQTWGFQIQCLQLQTSFKPLMLKGEGSKSFSRGGFE